MLTDKNVFIDMSTIPQDCGLVYQRKNKSWVICGFTCKFCGKTYNTLRSELYKHIEKCDGPVLKKSLED